MVASTLIIPRFILTFPLQLRKFHKFFYVNMTDKCAHYNSSEVCSKPLMNFITLQGANSRYLSTTVSKNDAASNSAYGVEEKDFNLSYSDILKAQKEEDTLIIDVREDSEIQETGKLPGSIHIPMNDVANKLIALSNSDFEQKYNRKKPMQNSKIVLSCRSGKRSGMVQLDLQKLGYKNAYNYTGGWLDWEKQQSA